MGGGLREGTEAGLGPLPGGSEPLACTGGSLGRGPSGASSSSPRVSCDIDNRTAASAAAALSPLSRPAAISCGCRRAAAFAFAAAAATSAAALMVAVERICAARGTRHDSCPSLHVHARWRAANASQTRRKRVATSVAGQRGSAQDPQGGQRRPRLLRIASDPLPHGAVRAQMLAHMHARTRERARTQPHI